MKVRDVYSPGAQVAHPDQPLVDAARAMLDHRVGALVVTDAQDLRRRPIGVLTDRDIVRGQLSHAADLYCLTVGEVMSREPLVVSIDLGIGEAIEAMNARAVRRAPVVSTDGELIGMVTLDDLVPALALQLAGLAELLGAQASHETPRAN
ncbi:MAG TPA: CBS domain-containing protein [Steroidobacteraceae bacterium]|nr:CBS domain-containing protein [Steroidobacteraceae bacterium]